MVVKSGRTNRKRGGRREQEMVETVPHRPSRTPDHVTGDLMRRCAYEKGFWVFSTASTATTQHVCEIPSSTRSTRFRSTRFQSHSAARAGTVHHDISNKTSARSHTAHQDLTKRQRAGRFWKGDGKRRENAFGVREV